MYLFYLPKGESGGGNAFPSLRGGAGGDIAADLRAPFQTPFERGISPAPGNTPFGTEELCPPRWQRNNNPRTAYELT